MYCRTRARDASSSASTASRRVQFDTASSAWFLYTLYTHTMPNPSRENRPSFGDPFGNKRRSVAEPAQSRVARFELTIEAMQHTLDIQFKRIAALQAQLDALVLKTTAKR